MKNPISILIAAGASALLASPLAAGPINPSRIPANATIYAHVDMQRLVVSELGRKLIARMTEEQNAQLRVFKRIFGFSPVYDLESVTLFSLPDYIDQGVLILTGVFDRDVLLDLISLNEAYVERIHRDVTVYSWLDENSAKMSHGAFYGTDTIILAEEAEHVENAIDVFDRRAPALETGSVDLLMEAGPAPILLVGVVNFEKMTHFEPDAAMLQQLKNGYLVIAGGDDTVIARLMVSADSPETTENVYKILQGLLALAALNRDNPQLQKMVAAIEIKRLPSGLEASITFPVNDTIDTVDPYL